METDMALDQKLALSRELVQLMEAGDEQQADLVLNELIETKERNLFQEVGRLTRDLHESIKKFLYDDRIAEIAEYEIPDASERLGYVITMTEKSANTSLNAVEQSLPLAKELGSKAADLAVEWARFKERELSVEDFRHLSRDLSAFLLLAQGHSEKLNSQLSEVLMAQDFQDLTGQIIRQVITLIHDVEDKLVKLVKLSGAKAPTQRCEKNKLEGPVVPGVDQGDTVNGQDDVDDLLSSLGF